MNINYIRSNLDRIEEIDNDIEELNWSDGEEDDYFAAKELLDEEREELIDWIREELA